MQNHGTVNFICPDLESEAMCQATFGPNFTLHECLHLGCHLSEDSTYEEWCEGGSCGYQAQMVVHPALNFINPET